jgi:hypothetical protein
MNSSIHEQLKEYAVEILVEKGFSRDLIKFEHNVLVGKKEYICDVAVVTKQHSVAIECGHTDEEKLVNLKCVFDEVIHIPYTALINPEKQRIPSEEISVYEKKIEELERKVQSLTKSQEKHCNRIIYNEENALINKHREVSEIEATSFIQSEDLSFLSEYTFRTDFLMGILKNNGVFEDYTDADYIMVMKAMNNFRDIPEHRFSLDSIDFKLVMTYNKNTRKLNFVGSVDQEKFLTQWREFFKKHFEYILYEPFDTIKKNSVFKDIYSAVWNRCNHYNPYRLVDSPETLIRNLKKLGFDEKFLKEFCPKNLLATFFGEVEQK